MKQQPHTITITTTTQSSVRKWSFTFNTLFASLYGKFHKKENFYYILMIFFFGFSSRNFEFKPIFFRFDSFFYFFFLDSFVFFSFFLWLRLLFLSLFEFVELTRYAGQNIVWGEEKNIICRTIWTFVDDFICYCSRIFFFFCFFVNCFICYLCMRICRDARW